MVFLSPEPQWGGDERMVWQFHRTGVYISAVLRGDDPGQGKSGCSSRREAGMLSGFDQPEVDTHQVMQETNGWHSNCHPLHP